MAGGQDLLHTSVTANVSMLANKPWASSSRQGNPASQCGVAVLLLMHVPAVVAATHM